MEWIYKYISATAIFAGIGVLIRYLIQKKIDSYFNKKIELYKQELNVITENTKYDLSKKLFDFEAYATQKHTIYPQIYKKIQHALLMITDYEVFRKELGTKNSREELKIILDNYFGGDQLTLKEMNVLLDNGAEIKKDLIRKKLKEATINLAEAADVFSKDILFLSKDTHDIAYETIKDLNKIHAFFYKDEYDSPEVSELFLQVHQSILGLKNTMQKELAYSHNEKS